MSKDKYIYHVTTNTGDSRKSYRSEVSEEAIAVCADMLQDIRRGERAEVPGMPGYWLSGRLQSKSAMFYLYAGAELILAFGVVDDDRRGGASLWRALHNVEGPAVKTDPDKQPDQPWLGVSLADAFARYPRAWGWTGDFERCIAWSLLEAKEGR